MPKKSILIMISFGFCFSLLLANANREVLAGGYMIPHQTARGLGLSNAVTAGVNDPSAVYYNPAALSEIQGDSLLISGTYVNLQNSVENSGRKSTNQHDDNFLASLFANYHIPGSDFTLGLALIHRSGSRQRMTVMLSHV